MAVSRYILVLGGLAVLLASAEAALAQQNPPTIGYVYPAGGKQGTTVQVTVGGQFLQGVKTASISGQGVRATIVEHVGPLPQKQLEELREQLKELRQRKQAAGPGMGRRWQPATQPAWTTEDDQQMARIAERLETFARTRVVQAFADTVTLDVTIAPDAPLGCRTLRLEAGGGLTNPMVFCVGRLSEFDEPVAKGAARFGISDERPARRMPGSADTPESQVDITLPVVVNGQITAGDRDRYRFTARKGQRLVAAVQARQLLPYLADAVPGWFQALVAIYDADGNELACADHYRFDPDPVVSCVIPADGQYILEIADALYRGREDFVYRIGIGQLPYVRSIFPLGGPAGALTAVEVTGWNLPQARLAVNCKDRLPGLYPVPDGRERFLSSVMFAVDDLPECLEAEPNNEPAKAQPVKLPVIINGRIEQPGASDVFRFEGRAGETVVAEVIARRLGSPLDPAVRITDADGKQLAFNDDYVDKAAGLLTHQADSWLMVKMPADATCYVHLCDAQRKAGPEYAYRLRLSAPRPDFDLRITPSAINIRGGQTVPITVHAIRRDGFDGKISLSLKDAPAGFSLGGGAIPAGQDQVQVTLSAPREPPQGPLSPGIEGRAAIGERTVVHKALPADDRMQAFANHHLVPADEWKVCLVARPFPRGSGRVLSDTPVRIPAGGQAALEVAVPAGPLVREVQVELREPPEGIVIQKTARSDKGVRIVLGSDAAKARPGLKGNLVFDVFADRPQAGGGQGGNRRMPLGTLPAVPFEVVPAP